jgi:hypothetical protein
MKKINYPGYAVKISRWRRLMMWLWAVRHPFVSKGIINRVKEDQKALDQIYNMIMDREFLRALPPINIKKGKSNG